MSLKMTLYEVIKRNGVMNYSNLEALTKDLGRKADNFSRRMRELTEAGLVEPIRNEKGIIIKYKYVKPETYIKSQEAESQKSLF